MEEQEIIIPNPDPDTCVQEAQTPDSEWVNNTLLPEEIIDEYHICKYFPDDVIGIYQTFLLKTDYVPNKVMEAQIGGYTLDKDYTSVLQYRQTARTEISRLREANNEAE